MSLLKIPVQARFALHTHVDGWVEYEQVHTSVAGASFTQYPSMPTNVCMEILCLGKRHMTSHMSPSQPRILNRGQTTRSTGAILR
jgi:hypothetical protein